MEKPYIIGITGGSGSGKTTFIRALALHFKPHQLTVISQDDYYRPREQQQKDDSGIKNFDLPNSIDSQAFAEDIKKLIKGQTVTRQEYTFNNPLKKPRQLHFSPAPIIIVEGIFIFYEKIISELLDLKVFLEAKETLKVIRRIKRDKDERNYPLEDVLYRYQNHVMPTYESYIQPFRSDAHLIVNNNDSFEKGLAVLEGFIQSKLNEETRF